MTPDFQSEIENLAREARKESLDSRLDEVPKPPSGRRFSTILSIGLGLILVELGLFIALTVTSPTGKAVPRSEVVTRFDGRNDCQAVAYDTYRAIVSYMRDNGRPPKTLDELQGKYVQRRPVDPATGTPLRYTTNGKGFSLDCPATTSRSP